MSKTDYILVQRDGCPHHLSVHRRPFYFKSGSTNYSKVGDYYTDEPRWDGADYSSCLVVIKSFHSSMAEPQNNFHEG